MPKERSLDKVNPLEYAVVRREKVRQESETSTMFAREGRIIYVNEHVYVQRGVCKTLGHVKYSDNNVDSRLLKYFSSSKSTLKLA